MSKKYKQFNKVVGVEFTNQLSYLLVDRLGDISIDVDPEIMFSSLYDGEYSTELDALILKIINDVAGEYEMKTKYDWSKVPDDVKWIASNESGFAFGYKWEPLKGHLHSGFWYLGGETDFVIFPSNNPFKGNWRDSLEGRPK